VEWRLLRIPSLQSGIYALGRLQYAEKFEDQPEALRSTLLDAYIFQTSRRDLTNLSLQESRLRRQREKDLAELKQLQQERLAKPEARLNAAASAAAIRNSSQKYTPRIFEGNGKPPDGFCAAGTSGQWGRPSVFVVCRFPCGAGPCPARGSQPRRLMADR
jgi:hypothetical protein